MLKRYGLWLLGAFAVFLLVLGGWQLGPRIPPIRRARQADELRRRAGAGRAAAISMALARRLSG